MKRTGHAVAIALVMTAAICADRAVASEHLVRPQTGTVAGRLVSRLSTRFQRVLPTVRVYVCQRQGLLLAGVTSVRVPATDLLAPALQLRLSPLLLHLPPPLL